MKVLIENEAGSSTKHLYDEQTFQLKSTRTVQRPYPFPYGFIIGTQSGDGMCLDCFLLTRASAAFSGRMPHGHSSLPVANRRPPYPSYRRKKEISKQQAEMSVTMPAISRGDIPKSFENTLTHQTLAHIGQLCKPVDFPLTAPTVEC
jgi:hypothetical protein